MTRVARSGPGWHHLLPIITIAVSLLPFLLAPVRARELSPAGRGEFAFFQSSFVIISTVGALGARHAYYAMRGAQVPDQGFVGRGAAGSAWLASAVIGAPLVVISALQHSFGTTLLIAAVSAAGPVHLFVQLQLARAQFARNELRVATTTGIPALWEFCSNLVLVVINAMTVLSVSIMTILAELLRALISSTRGSRAVAPRDASRREYLGLLWRFAIVGAMPMLVSNVDIVTYGALIPASQLGYYAVAKLALTLLVFATIVVEGRATQAGGVFTRNTLILIGLLGAGALLGGIAGTVLVPPLFGSAYQPSANLFGAMAFVGFLGGSHVLLTARASSLGSRRLPLLSSSAVFLVAVALSVFVAQRGDDISRLAVPMGVGYAVGLIVLLSGLTRSYSSTEQDPDARP